MSNIQGNIGNVGYISYIAGGVATNEAGESREMNITSTSFTIVATYEKPEEIIYPKGDANQDGYVTKEDADYIGVGPVFETPTKPGRKSVGIEYVKWASENVLDIPFYAIGGINQENVCDVIKSGARNIAVVRAIINAPSPKEATIKFKKYLNDNNVNS